MDTHKKINELLAGFVLGELSQQQKSEVKTHLAECPQCSSELERLQALLECTSRISESSADQQMCESAKKAILSAVETEEIKSTSRPNTGPAFIWRTIMKSRITKLAVAAVIIIAVAVVINQFGGSLDGASVAWADVVEPILNAQTAIYSTIVGEEGKSPVIQDMVMGSRIRRTVQDIEGVSIIDLETFRVLSLDPEKKMAVYIDLKGLPQLPNHLEMLQNIITGLKDNPHFVVKELGEQEIDGKPAIGFLAKHPTVELTIWADTQTAIPIRIEQEGGQMSIVCRDFQFDVEMDESLFSMEVPEGYTLQETELDLFGSTEQDFIEGLRVWAEVLGNGEFPADVSVEEYVRQVATMKEKFDELELSDEEKLELGLKLNRHILFIRFFKGEGKWYYAGKGVKLGDAETAIFWYRPKDSETYRVIYGDLSVVEDVAPQDLPEPLPVKEDIRKSIGYQQWSKTEFVGIQEDQWHITASGDIIAHSRIDLRKGPRDTTTMPVTLPYSNGILESVTLGEAEVPYRQVTEGLYEVELALEQLVDGETNIECIWTLPFSTLKQVEYGYRTALRSLIPVASYKLTVVLEPDCGFEHTEDSSQRKIVPFTWNSDTAKMYFGSCALLIQKQEQ